VCVNGIITGKRSAFLRKELLQTGNFSRPEILIAQGNLNQPDDKKTHHGQNKSAKKMNPLKDLSNLILFLK
jgi:hypothetical protein